MSSGWTTLLLLITGLASAWMYAASLQAMQKAEQGSTQAALYITSPAWEQFDQQGRAGNHIQATRLEQWAGENSARLYAPLVSSGDDQRIPWRAQSAEGRIFADSRTLLLQRQVVLERQLGDRNVHIETEELMIDQATNTAGSDQPVYVRSGSWTIRAAGFRADMNGRKLDLLGQVQSHHE